MPNRLWLIAVIGLALMRLDVGSADARQMLRFGLAPWPMCTAPCPVDDPGSSHLDVQASRAVGSNGLVFKLKLSGLKKNGVPASVPNVRFYGFVYTEAFGCVLHNSDFVNVVNGKASLTVTAGALIPPIPETPGFPFMPCGAFGVFDTSNDAILVGGLLKGDDTD
jgi:hypothetical protein